MTLPVPITHLKNAATGAELEVFRCETDGGIVLPFQDSLELHAGHKLRNPVILKEGELEAIAEEWRRHDDLQRS